MIPTREVLCYSAIEQYIAQFGSTCPFNVLSWQDHAGDLIKHLMQTDCNTDVGNNALVALDYLDFAEEAKENGYIDERQYKLITEKTGVCYFSCSNSSDINGRKVQKENYKVTFRDLIDLLPGEE